MSLKLWTPHLEDLEANAKWAALREQIALAPGGHTPRTLSAKARACAYVGPLAEVEESLKELFQRELDAESGLVVLLTRAAVARRNALYEESLEYSERALESALALGNPILEGDAVFAVALTQSELGRIFWALDKYEQIQKTARFCGFRRSMAALNAAWILWDLGRIQSVKNTLPLVPDNFRPRLQLALALYHADRLFILKCVNEGFASDVTDQEIFKISMFLVEGIEVYGLADIGANPGLWLIPYLRRQYELSDSRNRYLAALALKVLSQDVAVPARELEAPWRIEVQALFLLTLLEDRNGIGAGFRKHYPSLRRLFEERHFEMPLVPPFSEYQILSGSSWAHALRSRWGLDRRAVQRDSSSLEAAALRGTLFVYIGAGLPVQIDFKKSPITVRLLQILAGPAKHSLTKAYVHEQLTACKYLPHLHDNRLHQLLHRLEGRLAGAGIPALFSMPGNNTIQLNFKLEVDG